MTRARKFVALSLVLAAAGACASDGPDRREVSLGRVELVSALTPFDACDDLLAYVRAEARELAGPYGLAGSGHDWFGGPFLAMAEDAEAAAGVAGAGRTAAPTPATVGVDHSATNNQEAGVDEPDLVKTDGRLLVSLARGELRVVDVAGEAPALRSTLRIDEGWSEPQLLLAGDRVLVLSPAGSRAMPVDARVASGLRGPEVMTTRVTVVDIGDPGAPRVVSTVHLEGAYVAARMVDGLARVVVRSQPLLRGFTAPLDESAESKAAAEANNEAVVASSALDDWLPSYAVVDGAGNVSGDGRLAECDEFYRPGEFSGAGTVTVATIDPRDPTPRGAASVIGGGDLVYATATNLYVTSRQWEPDAADETRIHAFSIADASAAVYRVSGSVPGALLNQFSMSEHDGVLRVASTVGEGDGGGRSESFVTTLAERDGRLAEVGRVGGLGKGERIYAVRFLGDLGYVVTFRQVDPLYVVDLRDPAAPAVRGELKIPGYSAYLHPVGDGLLLGIGQAATDEGRVQGTQVSLFDVSDPAAPSRVSAVPLGPGWSEAESDHHAFLWWPATATAVVPVQSRGAVAFSASRAGGVREVASLDAGGEWIRRSVVVGERLLTVSEGGIQTYDLRSFARGGALRW